MAAARRGRKPFNARTQALFAQPKDNVNDALLKQARKSGQLNLSSRGLSEVPPSVWRINIDLPEESKNVCLENSDEHWWDQVDLTKLILASNTLHCLHEDIRLLPALTVLDVHDNCLESLPESLSELRDLTRLMLSHNKLTHVPECLFKLTNLTCLHLAHNEITDIADGISYLEFVEDFDLSHNKLSKLPPSIGYLSKVTKFNVSNNEILEFPDQIGAMNALRVLDATHNHLARLPESLGTLEHLEQLLLRHNKLQHLPLLKSCHKLKDLQVGNNAIRQLSKEQMENLYSLSILDLRDNKVSEIPDEIAVLTALERLDLTNNDLSGLPCSLGTMTKLKSLVVDGNPMRGIRRDIIMRGTNEVKKYLRSRIEPAVNNSVDGGQMAAQSVRQSSGTSGVIGGNDGLDPHTVKATGTVEYSNKKVNEIPSDVWNLIKDNQIKIINFSKNQLSTWPDNLVLCGEYLQQLNLSYNRLSSISADVSLFLRLTYLDLRNNQIQDLPEGLKSLQQLREISLSFNRLKSVPSVLYGLPKLEILIASDCQIEIIDVAGVQKTPNLATLDLRNNNIGQVPPELGNCSQLRTVQLEGNAFRNPRPAILAKGTGPLLEWLRGRMS